MPQFELCLLGPPQVRFGGVDVKLDRNKGLALLAYLAVTGTALRRDELAALLWPELDQVHARGSLRRVLWSLTTGLPGPWWAVERETIGLPAGPALELDMARFRGLLAEVRAHPHASAPACAECRARLAEAADLYRGDFLAGFSLRGCPAFDEWQLAQAESLRAALGAALHLLAESQALQGQFEDAITYALRRLALDPLHEPAHQQLMRLYAAAGQQSAALRQYDACVRLLEAELGVAPHETTVQIIRAIRADQLPPGGTHAEPPAAAVTPLPPAVAVASVRPPPLEADGPRHLAALDRIARGQFVARELEWAQATGVWQRASAGAGQMLLVSGEPGIGKTRLVRQLARFAGAAGGRVLVGECAARGGRPYAPFAQIARELLDQSQAAPDWPTPERADLLRLARSRSGRTPRTPISGLADPAFERQRLFESFTAACLALAQAAPLLLVIEDLHWADAGTLALLQHLARQSGGPVRLLLLITYRDTEVDLSESRRLPDLLAELTSDRHAQAIRLERLSRQQSGRMLAALLATPSVSEAFRDGLYVETEGNPLFMEEVCKTLIEQGQLYFSGGAWHREDMRAVVLPGSVRAAILGRVARLPAATQHALRVAAVLGHDFDSEVLKTAADQDEAVLRTALAQARQAQLISDSPADPDRYRFAHALIPFTLREALGGPRLRRLHRQAARALEQVRPGDVEALAAHYTGAGLPAEALDYTRQAATRAQSLYDDETALQYLQAALSLAADAETRLALLEQVGDVHQQRDGNADAARAYQAALALGAGAGLTRVRLLRKLAEAVWITELIIPLRAYEPAADAALEEGLALMAGQPAHPETVRLLIARSHSAWRGRVPPDWAAAERDTRRAVALAEQLDAPLELSAALESLATVFASSEMFRERAEASLRRVALTDDRRFQASRERARALKEAGAALIDVGEYDRALLYLRESEELASRMHAGEVLVFGLHEQARCLFYLDRWDEVFMEAKFQASPPLQPTCVHQALMASVHALRGEHDAAAVLRDESVAYMVAIAGTEAWSRGAHY